MLETFLTTHSPVSVAEIVGDKLLYTSGVLAKMAAAVDGILVD